MQKNSEKSCSAKARDLRTHFKNMFHVGRAIKGMLLNKAITYLNDVLEHKRCIPVSRYETHMGRCAQATEFGLTKGIWPQKSVKIVIALLQNAKASAEAKKLAVEKLIIKNVIVNKACKGRRRTYRAHGSINAYLSSNCHIDILCEEKSERVAKEKNEKEEPKKFICSRKLVRKACAKAFAKHKYVEVGKPKTN